MHVVLRFGKPYHKLSTSVKDYIDKHIKERVHPGHLVNAPEIPPQSTAAACLGPIPDDVATSLQQQINNPNTPYAGAALREATRGIPISWYEGSYWAPMDPDVDVLLYLGKNRLYYADPRPEYKRDGESISKLELVKTIATSKPVWSVKLDGQLGNGNNEAFKHALVIRYELLRGADVVTLSRKVKIDEPYAVVKVRDSWIWPLITLHTATLFERSRANPVKVSTPAVKPVSSV